MEYYERYRRFEKRETNHLIDEPIVFFKGFTKNEVLVGAVMFVCAIYVSTYLLTGLFVLASAGAPLLMQHLRLNKPQNYFAHLFWYWGINNGKNHEFKRPNGNYLTL